MKTFFESVFGFFSLVILMLLQIVMEVYKAIVSGFLMFLSRIAIFFTFRSRSAVYLTFKIITTIVFVVPMLTLAVIEFAVCTLIYICGKTISTVLSWIPIISTLISSFFAFIFYLVSKVFQFLNFIMLVPDYIAIAKSNNSDYDGDFDDFDEDTMNDIPMLYNRPRIK